MQKMVDRSKCIFCKIADGLEKNEIMYSDDDFIVFRDIKPVAKHHYLVIPKEHVRDIKALTPEQKLLIEKLVSVGTEVLEKQKADMDDTLFGFHCPPFNTVSHLHLHAISPASEMKFFSRLAFKPNTWWFATPSQVISRL